MYRIVLWQGDTAHYVMNPTSQTANLERYAVTSATLDTQVNGAGVLTFTVYDSHPEIAALKAAVNDQTYHVCAYRVEEDLTNTMVFNGRVYTWSYSPLEDQSVFVCEDFYAKLNDYIVRPYHYAGTVRGYLEMLLDNSGEFLVAGDVTVADSNDYIVRSNESATTLWDEISSKCIGSSLGGFIEVRDDERTVDWLAVPSATTDQVLAARSQLLTLTREEDTTDAFSVVYPFGADTGKENEYGQKQRLTLARYDVEGNLPSGYTWYQGYNAIRKDSVYDVVGWRAIVATYDDVTTQSSLLAHAIATLDAQGKPPVISVSAVDLSDAGFDVQTLEAGCSVQISADGVSTTRMLTRVSRDLLDPASSSFEFGELDAITSGGSSGGSGGGGSTTSPHFWHTDVENSQFSPSLTEPYTGMSTLPLEDALTDIVGAYSEIDGGAVWLVNTPKHNNVPYDASALQIRANNLNARIVSASLPLYEAYLTLMGTSAMLGARYTNTTRARVSVDGYNGNVDITAINAVNVSADTNITGSLDIQGGGTLSHSDTIDTDQSDSNVSANTYYPATGWMDRDGRYFAFIQAAAFTNGTTRLSLAARNLVNNSTRTDSYLTLDMLKDGTKKATFNGNVGIAGTITAPVSAAVTNISDVLTQTSTQAANWPITAVRFQTWGSIAALSITVTPTAAKSANYTNTLGTIIAGKRPCVQAGGAGTYLRGGIATGGSVALCAAQAMTANTSYTIGFMYLLA